MNSDLSQWFLEKESELPATVEIAGLSPVSQALFLSELAKRKKAPVVVVMRTRAEARALMDNLEFFVGRERTKSIHYFPQLEIDYHRALLPNPEIISERNVFLFHALENPKGSIFITTVGALIQKCVSMEAYLNAVTLLQKDKELPRELLIQKLLECGYQRQPSVTDPGSFAVRGGVIDVFSPLYSSPLRVLYFDDLIEEVRCFDPSTQRTEAPLEKAYVIPCSAYVIPSEENIPKLVSAIKDRLDELEHPKLQREEIIQKIKSRQSISAEGSYLYPILSGSEFILESYFPKDTVLVWEGKKILWEQAIEQEYPALNHQIKVFEEHHHPIAKTETLVVDRHVLKNKMDQGLFLESVSSSSQSYRLQAYEPTLVAEGESLSNLKKIEKLSEQLRDWMDQGYRVNLVCHTGVQQEKIRALLANHHLNCERVEEGKEVFSTVFKNDFQKIALWQGVLLGSQVYPDFKLIFISEELIFGAKKRHVRSSYWVASSDPNRVIASFRELKEGDYIVHREHGIGRYLGLTTMDRDGAQNDFVLLEYKDGDKLYIPVYRLNVLQKYVGSEAAHPPLDKLGTDRWTKAKSKAQKAVVELAAELLKIQAQRKLTPAFACAPPSEEYLQFEMAFPFDETPDQAKAISDLSKDLERTYPADRLICGDVGYGKTEVAMRAAYRVALEGYQVAVMVPTTLLAFQHYESFKKRFEGSPIRLESVSRLKSESTNKKILADVQAGKVDVLIGTHRLISADVNFKKLGLLVIDEEHRFGVVHKEKLRKKFASVHTVSMTATPIPRTLHMGMSGIKDISLITTPPADRLSVRTFICRFSDEIIKESIQNELARGGQVFVVHNRIETLDSIADTVRNLFPNVALEVTHGQMDPDELENKILNFYKGDAKILIATSIVESGLDIPNANTMIIDRADMFGLAQLYQLRGRIGRSDRRGYCYLLTPEDGKITQEAKQRLDILQRYSELGSGFSIASHDLDMRGAGDLLGSNQSGHLNAVGIDLYFELLESSIQELQGSEAKIEIEPEISIPVAASFPLEYLPDISEKVGLYRRLSSATSEDQVMLLEEEIRDRFGPPPEEVKNLISLMRLKVYLKQLHVVRMSCGPKKTSLQFADTTPVTPQKVVGLVKKFPKVFAITPDQKLVFTPENNSLEVLLRHIQNLTDVLI